MKSMKIIRLLLVDDHPVVRNGLRQVQEIEPRIRIVGEAGTVGSAVKDARRLAPDIILMDMRLSDGSGVDACRQIKRELPATCILFLTSYATNRLVLAAMEAGANGYLLKESDAHRIVEAIHTILRGGSVFDPVLGRRKETEPENRLRNNPLDLLTVQERRVMEEVSTGKTDKEVASSLGLTTKTARNYLDRIFIKLDVHTRTEAAMLFARATEEMRPQLDIDFPKP